MERALESDRVREGKTACCIRNDGSGCVQTSSLSCSVSLYLCSYCIRIYNSDFTICVYCYGLTICVLFWFNNLRIILF